MERNGYPEDTWYNFSYSPLRDESGAVGGMFCACTETTAQVLAKQSAAEVQERQAFLLRFSDALRAQPNDDAVVDLATRMLAEELGLDRCYATAMYPAEDRVDVTHEFRRSDLAPMPSLLRFSDFPEAGKRTFDRTLIFNDTANDPELTDADKSSLAAMSFGALLSSPLRQGAGGPIWALGAVSSQPRRWTPGEVALVEETAERTWVAMERARANAALSESEARYRQIVEGAEDFSIVTLDKHGVITSWNSGAERLLGYTESEAVAQPGAIFFNDEDRAAGIPEHEMNRAQSEGRTVNERWHQRKDGSLFWGSGLMMRLEGDGGGYLKMFRDRTAEHEAEAASRESEERQAFLLKLSDALRPLGDPLEVQAAALRVLGEHLAVNRAFFNDVDEERDAYAIHRTYANGVAPLTGHFRLSEIAWTAELAGSGQIVVFDDAGTDPRLSEAERASYAAMDVVAGIGVPLIKDGRWVAGLGVHHAAPRHWTPEDIDLIRETAERTWAAVERARAEAAKRAGEERYRALFDNMAEGFALFDVVRAPDGQIIDLIYREANKALELQGGLDRAKTIGQPLTAILPPADAARFIPVLARAADPGEPVTVEEYAEVVDRWFEVSAYPHGQDKVVAFYRDISERKRAEVALRESEERQAFLLKLNDALRPLTDPVEVQATAAGLLGKHLDVDRSNYYEVDADGWVTRSHGYVSGEVIVPERIPLNGSGQLWADSYLAGRTDFVSDIATDDRWSDSEREKWRAVRLSAALGVPLLKGGRLCAILGLNNAEPHHWTESEIALAEEVAERTWAAVERARAEAAMRESEAKLRDLFDTMRQGYHECEMIRDAEGRAIDYRLTAMNPAFEQMVGIPVADAVRRTAREIVPGLDDWWVELFDEVVKAGEQRVHEYEVPQLGRWYRIDAYPKGGDRAAALFDDITERKLAEAALRESEERQAFLLKLSDALRVEPSAEAVANRALRMLFEQMGLDRCYIGIYRLEEDRADFPHQVHDDRLPPMPAQLRFSDFPEAIQIAFDKTLVIDDVAEMKGLSDGERASFDGIGVRSSIVATLRKGENNPLWAIGAASTSPRVWTQSEVFLVEEVAERTWAAVERARAEAAMRESEERQRLVLNSAPGGFYSVDREGTTNLVSRGFMELMGFAGEEEVLGRKLHGLIHHRHPDGTDYPVEDCPIYRCARSGAAAHVPDELFFRLDGSAVPVEYWVAPIMRGGEHIGAICTILDLTRRKQDEQALAAKNRRLDLLARTASGLLLDKSPDERLETAFAAIAREVGAEHYFNYLTDEADPAAMRLASSGGLTDAQHRAFERIAVGEYLCGRVAANRQPLIIADLDRSDDPACAGVIDLEGKCYAGFPLIAEGRLLGTISFASTARSCFTDDEVALMKTVADQVAAALDRDRAMAALRQSAAEFEALAENVSQLNETLEERVEQRTSELTKAQDALRQSQKLEAMGQLTGGVAHDFNNLLTPIVGSLDLLQRKGLGDAREQRLIDGALQSAERARILVQRLLAFARRQPLQPSAVDVADLIAGMAELVASTSGPGIKVEVAVADDLPPALADPNQLEMAILNLAVNARDAMRDGGTLTIAATDEEVGSGHRSNLPSGRYVHLSVADNGAGMDQATVVRAIEPFFSTKGIGKGTGLGLSMVHGLASQLGGALAVSSKIGLGTRVDLWLPVAAAAAGEVVRSPDPLAGERKKGTVLLVDDEELVRMSTADMLGDLGYQVVEAESAEAALAALDGGLAVDLLITDHLMPGMTGADLARTMIERSPGTAVLIVTGYADTDQIAPDLPRLAKPFRQADLTASIAALTA